MFVPADTILLRSEAMRTVEPDPSTLSWRMACTGGASWAAVALDHALALAAPSLWTASRQHDTVASMTDRAAALRVMAALCESPIGESGVLVGSSALFGFDTAVQALTEDVDVSVPESIVEQHGAEIVAGLSRCGFSHESGTATFESADGVTFDLLGHGQPQAGDLRPAPMTHTSLSVAIRGSKTPAAKAMRRLSRKSRLGCERSSRSWREHVASRTKLSADERLRALTRDKARVRRERLQRELAGPRWQRMMQIIPAFFEREGIVTARIIKADRATVLAGLRQDGVFGLDTALRLVHHHGVLSASDIHVYLRDAEPLVRLGAAGLIGEAPYPDTVISRPWAGPPRVLACLVETPPPSRDLEDGFRVVSEERMRRELLGEIGARPDLFALIEQ